MNRGRPLTDEIQMLSTILYSEKMNKLWWDMNYANSGVMLTKSDVDQIYYPYGRK